MRNFIVNFEKCKILNGVKFLIYVCTFIKIERKKYILACLARVDH